jgi:predicted AlkP superfamily pyrophosphatase or phosphodiesterase
MKGLYTATLVLFAMASAPAEAQQRPPKLIVAISVDQFSARLFNEYRGRFTGGLRRLSEGIAFANGYQSHGTTETCPGHSTILTGNFPAHTGIVANDWADASAPRAKKNVYCAEDERVPPPAGVSYTVSAAHLRVATLGDRMKAANPASRVVSVAGKDRSAVMMGGHNPDQRWWWSGNRFIQNSATSPSPVADLVNQAVAGAIAQARPPLVPPPYCESKDKAVDLGGGKTVGTFRFERAAGDAAAFAAGPEVDAATLAFAAALARDMQLGAGNAPDLLAVGLSATDFVGHRYGPGGLEMCLQLTSLDKDLQGFFSVLDALGIDYAVVLTADHGGLDIPERTRGVPNAARLSKEATSDAIGAEVSRRLGFPAPAFSDDFYLSSAVPDGQRAAALNLARELLLRQPQVESVFTKAEVAAHPLPAGKPETWSLLDRVRASFDPARSPDLAIVYKENVTLIPDPSGKSIATHGSPWDYDRKVPILFWWNGAPKQDRPESASTVDILPTLASLIGLPVPQNEIDGHCIDLDGNCAN